MEKLYRAQLEKPKLRKSEVAAQNPIEYDNKPAGIENGDMKSLDYLNYSGTIVKGTLGAKGEVKLRPCNYGTYSPYERENEIIEPIDKEPEEEFENTWDNIFLNRGK